MRRRRTEITENEHLIQTFLVLMANQDTLTKNQDTLTKQVEDRDKKLAQLVEENHELSTQVAKLVNEKKNTH